MKKVKCCCLLGYSTKNMYVYGKISNYYDLLDDIQDENFILKNDFQFFNNCPMCGAKIDKIQIISKLKIDLNKYLDRRLYDNSK